jgi:hypothetical protein
MNSMTPKNEFEVGDWILVKVEEILNLTPELISMWLRNYKSPQEITKIDNYNEIPYYYMGHSGLVESNYYNRFRKATNKEIIEQKIKNIFITKEIKLKTK